MPHHGASDMLLMAHLQLIYQVPDSGAQVVIAPDKQPACDFYSRHPAHDNLQS